MRGQNGKVKQDGDIAMTKSQITNALRSWMQIGTWHTDAPGDQKRFNTAMSGMISTHGCQFEHGTFREALTSLAGELYSGWKADYLEVTIDRMTTRALAITSSLAETKTATISQITKALKSWMQVGTWHTDAPGDQKRFYTALSDMISTHGCQFEDKTFRKALTSQASEMYPGWKAEYLEATIDRMTTRAVSITSSLADSGSTVAAPKTETKATAKPKAAARSRTATKAKTPARAKAAVEA